MFPYTINTFPCHHKAINQTERGCDCRELTEGKYLSPQVLANNVDTAEHNFTEHHTVLLIPSTGKNCTTFLQTFVIDRYESWANLSSYIVITKMQKEYPQLPKFLLIIIVD